METTIHEHDVSHDGNAADTAYNAWLELLNARFVKRTKAGAEPVFTTDADDLFEVYLESFPEGPVRQYHNCHACRRFLERFGGLVTIDDTGRTRSVMWNAQEAPSDLEEGIAALARAVTRADVTGVFLSPLSVWGEPRTGIWRHMAITDPPRPYPGGVLTAEQAMAEKREDYKTVSRALGEFKEAVLGDVVHLLRSDALYRSEKVLGQAEWLYELQKARTAARGPSRTNLVWRAIASAPAGFCHPRSSMIGTLLADITDGLPFATVAERFREKMSPVRYQRPTAAPSVGTVQQAERVFEQMGAAKSLERRFAKLEEIQTIWLPEAAKEAARTGGLFSHLKTKEQIEHPTTSLLHLPPQTLTWVKFRDTVLPSAQRIQMRAPALGAYSAMVTAVHEDAPPIIQWDNPERRNPVSWYFELDGTRAHEFGLTAGQYYDLSALAYKPSMWQPGFEHMGAGVFFVMPAARETRRPSACLFPEILRKEFHPVRSVVEAYSKAATIDGVEEGSVFGVLLDAKSSWRAELKVWSDGRCSNYLLDRWD